MISQDLGLNALLRDAYTFGTPAMCDVDSQLSESIALASLHISFMRCLAVFNQSILEDSHTPRTLWRVVNENGIVVTGVPKFGDPSTEDFQEGD